MRLIKNLNSIIFLSIILSGSSGFSMSWLFGSNKKDNLENLPNVPPGGTINYNNNIISPNQEINITVFSADPLKYLAEMYDQSKADMSQKFSGLSTSVSKCIKDNQKNIFYCFLASAYAGVNTRLAYITRKLNQSDCWSFWQKSKTLEELYQVPHSEFSKLLLTDIQRRYTPINNPTDFVTPLISFIHDANKEEKELSEYIKFNKLISRLHIKFLFFFDSKILEKEAPERLKRISFMKNTFLSWLTDYKMTQAQKNELAKKISKYS